jgi:hypothetical protein
MSPTTIAELESNVEILRLPPMSAEERAHWDGYGDLVHGKGQDAFETDWP